MPPAEGPAGVRRVVITGLGLRIPGASNLASLASLYRSGKAATVPLTGALAGFTGGRVVDDDIDGADTSKMDRSVVLALAAAADAVAQAGLTSHDPALTSAGVYVGCGGGGMGAIEQSVVDVYGDVPLKGTALVKSMANAAAAHISIAHGCQGPSLTYAMACSSSAHAIGEAVMAIRHGRCATAIAGGTEAALTLSLHRSWTALRLLATGADAACRPFCYERTGLLLAEGSVFYILESLESARARKAPVLCEIRGYGARSDASHITAPSAEGQARTMAAALDDAGMAARDIGHVSAHGTATLTGDLAETRSITAVFGDHARNLAISATKSFHGHLLGGAGAVALLASLLAVNNGLLAPTTNFGTNDPDLDLDYIPNQARETAPVGASLCNAFGFGGSNATLIVAAPGV